MAAPQNPPITQAEEAAPTPQRWISPNEFGDMFGCLSCLFSGLAFAGLIVSIKQQRVDIQRQVAEMRRSQAEFEKQTVLAQKQIMTTTMFEYMKNMIGKREALERKGDIVDICNFLMNYFESGKESKDAFTPPSNEAINEFREKMESLSTWRRTISSWFQRVDQTNLCDKDKRNYKIDFWHLFSRQERAASYFQIFLFSDTHKKDVQQMETLFKDSVLIRYTLNKQENDHDDAEKRYALLKELLAEMGDGFSKLPLGEKQIEKIISRHFQPLPERREGNMFIIEEEQNGTISSCPWNKAGLDIGGGFAYAAMQHER